MKTIPQKSKIGNLGELTAVNFLKSKGYVILEQNFRSGRDEADIIAQINDIIVFVEVKTRSGNAFGEPHEAVDKRKVRALVRCADAYLRNIDSSVEIRFDVIGVYTDGNNNFLPYHIEDAFREE